MFEDAKASAKLNAKGLVLVYAHVGERTCGRGWYAYTKPSKARIARLKRSMGNNDFRMEELDLGEDII